LWGKAEDNMVAFDVRHCLFKMLGGKTTGTVTRLKVPAMAEAQLGLLLLSYTTYHEYFRQ